jgi:hypothetical protein
MSGESIRVPWVYLALGDRDETGRRPVLYRPHGEMTTSVGKTKARVVAHVENDPEAFAVMSEACEALNAKRNADDA